MPENTFLQYLVKTIAVCEKITHEQRRLLPGGSVVTTQRHVDTLFMPTLTTEAGNTVFVLNIFLNMILVALQIATRPRFEL